MQKTIDVTELDYTASEFIDGTDFWIPLRNGGQFYFNAESGSGQLYTKEEWETPDYWMSGTDLPFSNSGFFNVDEEGLETILNFYREKAWI